MSFRGHSLPLRLRVEALEERCTPATLFALTNSNQIVRFDSASPGTIGGTAAIQGLNAGEQVVGIDYRPRTGGLYGLAVDGNGTGTNARLVLINPLTGAAGEVGTGFTLTSGDPTARFGFDFNPTADRIRVVTSTGLNLRVNPNDGAVTADTPLVPRMSPHVDGAAYDRNFDAQLGTNGTTLYTISSADVNLQTQGGVNGTPSPNGGTRTTVGPLGVGIDPNGSVGFDIAANGAAYGIWDSTGGAPVTTRLFTVNLATGAATDVGLVGDGSGSFLGLAVAPESRVAVGSGSGTDARVEVYDPFSGTRLRTIDPYPGYRGGVTTAVGDVNRDGVPDVITGAIAGGGPHVKVFDGTSGAELYSFFAYDPGFRGGVTVAAGDVNADGWADVVTGAGPGGGPHVKAFSGKDGTELASYFPYDAGFTGGVRVATGDFNNDGRDEIVTAAGPTGGPHVRLFGVDATVASPFTAVAGLPDSFFAYDPGFTGGVWVAVGDTNGDGTADIVTGADTGGGPHVRAFNGKTGAELASFFAFDSDFTGGVRVGTGDADRDGRAEIFVGPASNRAPVLRAFDGNTGNLLRSYDVVDGASSVFLGGFVGA